MAMFPGRFLEEIDQIDSGRVIRARIAKQYEDAEERRRLFLGKKLKSLDEDDWELIKEMDEIMGIEGS